MIAVEHHAGKWTVQITDRRTKVDRSRLIKYQLQTVDHDVSDIVLVKDNLNTDSLGLDLKDRNSL